MKHRIQRYRKEWEKKPEFRLWLRPDEHNLYKAKCEKCDVTMKSAELTVIKNHAKTDKHKKNCAENRKEVQKTLTKFVSPIDDQVLQAEIKLCAFLVAHNISFRIVDHLSDLIKNIFVDSKIAQEIRLKRTKPLPLLKMSSEVFISSSLLTN